MKRNKFWTVNLLFGLAMTMLPFFVGEDPLILQAQLSASPKEEEIFDEDFAQEEPLQSWSPVQYFVPIKLDC